MKLTCFRYPDGGRTRVGMVHDEPVRMMAAPTMRDWLTGCDIDDPRYALTWCTPTEAPAATAG